MRKMILMLVAICLMVTALPAFAEPGSSIRERSWKHIGPKHCTRYDALHDWAVRTLGAEAVGRDICRYGMPKPGPGHRVPTKAEFHDTYQRLKRWKNPPPAPAPTQTGYQPQASTLSGGGGCTGMSAESGSAGYGAYNSAGPGYIGCYQISSDHYNGGSCTGLGTDPAGQDACAQRICATEGPGAWTNSAGQNPCGRP